MRGREIKSSLRALFKSDDPEKIRKAVEGYPEQQVISPLLSFLYSSDAKMKHHAVTAIGRVVANLAERDMESARVVMRRLMWNLNDESGGIGWGSPEAMGEIMANHRRLAEEYHKILISYINPKGNYLEHEGLQKEALWAIKRLAQVDPTLLKESLPFLFSFLKSDEETLRQYAARAILAIEPEALHLIPERCIEGGLNER